MGDYVTTIVLAIVGSNAIFTFVQFLLTRRDTRRDYLYVRSEDIAPLKNAELVILQTMLETLMTKYILDGKVTVYQFKCIRAMLSAYEDLGGDGFIHDLYNQTCDLLSADDARAVL